VKCKVALGGLAVIGALALSATGAQAGAGGSPTTLLGFFVCHTTSGAAPVGQFDVESPVFGPVDNQFEPILQRFKLGRAALACAFARLFPAVPAPRPPEPDAEACAANPLLVGCPVNPSQAEQMTCYTLSRSNQNDQGQQGQTPPSPKYTVLGDVPTPGFDPTTDPPSSRSDVPVSPTGVQFLCAPGAYFLQ